MDPVGASVFTMFVPRGHRLKGCYLEMQVWHWQDGKSETCIGSVTLHGEDLVSFLEGHGSVQEDDDLFEDYDEDDATGIATPHRSFTLQASQSLPRETQALYSDIKGRIILRGRSKRCESESLINTSHGVTQGTVSNKEHREEEEEDNALNS